MVCCRTFEELIRRSDVEGSAPLVERLEVCWKLQPGSGKHITDNDKRAGFLTCTESLGFESSDERAMLGCKEPSDRSYDKNDVEGQERRHKRKMQKRTLKFPPPIGGFDRSGRRCSYLRAERKDGKFMLTEVWIDRPEIFTVTRENGRLTLHFACPIIGRAEDREMVKGNDNQGGDGQDGFWHNEAPFLSCRTLSNNLSLSPRCVATT